MRLHIVPDEKIINRCIDSFETVYPGENKYIVVTRNPQEHRYVTERPYVFFLRYNTQEFWRQIGDVSKYASIIIHFLQGDSIDFVLSISHPCIYWIEWGADLYRNMLKPKGYKIYADKSLLWKIDERFKYKLIFTFHEFLSEKKSMYKMYHAAKKVKYFVPDSMYDEYPLLLKYYPGLKHLKYRDFFYYPIDEILGEKLINKSVQGNNIIIGNSASLTNNHLYVFDKFKSITIIDRKIIVPLSYGANKKYIQMVSESGKQTFGENYYPVYKYMPLNEYNDLLISASHFIYGNWRQEAVGNILIALYLGGKVFLDRHNPLLSFYRSKGLILFDMEDLNYKELSTILESDFVDKNRRILREMYSRERQLQLIKNNF